MSYKSQYFTSPYPLPAGWTQEDFLSALELLESTNNRQLFFLAADLGVETGSPNPDSPEFSPSTLIQKIIHSGGPKDGIINLARKASKIKSRYFSREYLVPKECTPKEFWWAGEQLEKFGDEYSLFDLAWSLGIKFDLKLKGTVEVVDLLIVILTEGGSKEEVVKAVKQFVEERTKKQTNN